MTICMLPIEVISQISAGEIINNPSSVVKELIENSIDSGATKIYIDIEKGGLQSISVSDNGSGISKKDLKIAILRHTTSKIFSLSDLENISSLGFRGEALSSITSISRTTLISCTKNSNKAWSLYTEGYDNPIIFKPTSHPIGTTVIVSDLFYNVPVRRKSMQTEKSEFLKIYEIVRSLILSKEKIDFTLRHNNKLIKHYAKVNDNQQKIIRLKNLFGYDFVKNIVPIKSKNNFISLSGWISLSETYFINQNKQYYYINNRIINNQVIRHALRQGIHKEVSGKNIFFSSILYITIPSHQIDINIHPDKSEIKFNKSRLIHDFIYETVVFSLKSNKKNNKSIKFTNCVLKNINVFDKNYLRKTKTKHKKIDSPSYFKNSFYVNEELKDKWKKRYFFKKTVLFNNFYQCFGYLLSLVNNYYVIIENNIGFSLISLPMAQRLVFISNICNSVSNKIELFILLQPLKIKIVSIEKKCIIKNKNVLLKFGLYFCIHSQYFYLQSIPMILKKQDWKKLFLCFLKYIFLKKNITYELLLKWFALNIKISKIQWNDIKIIKVLSDMEKFCPYFIEFPPEEFLQPININKYMRFLTV